MDITVLLVLSKSLFYEYFNENKTMYCYNDKGELVREIVTNGFGFTGISHGSICITNSKMIIANHKSSNLIVI